MTTSTGLSVREILTERGIFPARVNERSNKDRWGFLCPFHNDSDPSLWLHPDDVRWKCWVCGVGGGPRELLRLFGEGYVASPLPKADKPKSKGKPTDITGCTLEQLAQVKGLPVEHLRDQGWYDTTYSGKPAVAIPWPGGTHYRVNLDANPKYLWSKGSKVGILGLDRLEEIRRGGWVLFVEGDTDYAAGRLMGLPVVALPGASTWKAEWALQFQGCQVYVWREPDQGGRTFTEKLGQSFNYLKVIDAPEGIKDLCDLHDQAGDGAGDLFHDLKAEARPYHENPVPKPDVGNNYSSLNSPIDKSDKWIAPKRDNTKRSALWDFARETFPYPAGQPKVYSHILYSEDEGAGLIVDLIVDTWFSAVNAQFKRQKFYFHCIKKLHAFPGLYEKDVAVDDWSETYHASFQKAIERAGGQYLAIDNQLSRGCWRYVSTVPIRDFLPLEDPSAWLIDALKGIRVPEQLAKGQRFRPILGSQELTKGCQAPVDEDQGKFRVVAEKKEATDWTAVEAEVRGALPIMSISNLFIAPNISRVSVFQPVAWKRSRTWP